MGGGGFAGDHGNGAGRDPGRPVPGRLPDPDHLVIPDDISELDAEVRAFRRDLIRRRWLSRLHLGGWRQYGLSAPVVVMTVVLIALISGLAMLLTPLSAGHPQPAPLAEPATSPGTVGGLLPDTTLMLYNDVVPLRTRRPAVIAIPRPDCGCESALDTMYMKARTHQVQFDLVALPWEITELRRLDRRVGNGGALVFSDPSGTLIDTYASAQLTVLIVGVDGVVLAILNDPTASTPIESLLKQATREA